ncbi:sugar ABC transporter substrate-binding protein [Caldovatus aquaticus]|uniref:Sugar ABC transporter substrate-binding protein n=1 Tax=Caldovatus aquaticus TaxID=2865671 RepID=A0ABS7F5W3_9PROT|nr:sugar ABC transporter substrate-binding protein [Caldovatus aquaticus]
MPIAARGRACPPAASRPRLAVFVKNGENPNYRAFLLGAARAAAAHGARILPQVPSTPDDPVEQAALVRRALREIRPDAILFAPADDRAMEGPVAELNAAGIPLVGFVNRMRGRFVSFVGADDEAMARAAAARLIAALGGAGRVALIEGPETAPTSRDRGRGFRAEIARHPGIVLLGSAPGRYLRRGGYAAMRALLAAHPRIEGVIATNDSMALGALDALEEQGRRALVVGNNGIPEAVRAVGEGRLLATMDYDGFRMGALAALAALRHLGGLPVPAEILLPAAVIHRGNHAAWLTPPEARPLPAWDAFVRG